MYYVQSFFVYLSTIRIPKLLAIIRYYDWMCRIPYPIFNQIQKRS